MRDYLRLGLAVFEVYKANTNTGQAIIDRFESPYKVYRSIYDAYKRPSHAKVKAWETWQEWYRTLPAELGGHDVEKYGMFVSSRCTSNFTISAKLTKGERLIYLFITKDHNKAVIV